MLEGYTVECKRNGRQEETILLVRASGPITSWEIDREPVEPVSDFIFGGSKITAVGDCSHAIKRRLLHGRKSYDQPR